MMIFGKMILGPLFVLLSSGTVVLADSTITQPTDQNPAMSSANSSDPLVYKFASHVDTLQCDGHNIYVLSAGIVSENPALFENLTHTVSFVSIEDQQLVTKTVAYVHADQDTPIGPSSISCVHIGGKPLVSIWNSNGGNCESGCEWIDVFSVEGNYLGSTKGLLNDGNFKFKPLDTTLLKSINDALSNSTASTTTNITVLSNGSN